MSQLPRAGVGEAERTLPLAALGVGKWAIPAGAQGLRDSLQLSPPTAGKLITQRPETHP